MTYDGINIIPIDNSLNGSYCESSDWLLCTIKNGLTVI